MDLKSPSPFLLASVFASSYSLFDIFASFFTTVPSPYSIFSSLVSASEWWTSPSPSLKSAESVSALDTRPPSSPRLCSSAEPTNDFLSEMSCWTLALYSSIELSVSVSLSDILPSPSLS